jgi:hypothetical protein
MGTLHSQGQMDALARSRGFPDYATWVAWNAKRSAALQQPAPQQPTNFLQNLLGKIPVHPINILNYVNDKYQGATGQK